MYDRERDWTEQAVEDTTKRLAEMYRFDPRHVYDYSPVVGFAAELSDKALAGIRCEPVVKYVEQNARFSTAE